MTDGSCNFIISKCDLFISLDSPNLEEYFITIIPILGGEGTEDTHLLSPPVLMDGART